MFCRLFPDVCSDGGMVFYVLGGCVLPGVYWGGVGLTVVPYLVKMPGAVWRVGRRESVSRLRQPCVCRDGEIQERAVCFPQLP